MTERRALRALVALVALAAALRFWRIGHQSFWLDETFTASIAREGFLDVFREVSRTESTPPLYYVLVWAWAKVAGHGEAGLRSLSAVLGVATVPVAYAAARVLLTTRVALVAAALVAVNPWLVWYSQEARAYSLLVLLSTAGLLYFLRAWRRGERRDVVLWAVCSALAVLTHYFAAFLIAPEALWLLWTTRRRDVLAASAAVAAVGIALAPLALHQRASGHTAFIESISLGRRVTDLAKKFVTGELGTPTPGLGPLAGALVVAGLVLALRRATRTERDAVLLLGGLVGVALATPLLLAAAGLDYLFPRNALAVFVPAALILAAGYGAERWGRAGLAAAAVLCATAVAVVVQTGVNADLQRDDWRGLADALGPATGPRAIVLNPQVQVHALEHYAGRTQPFPPAGAAVHEVDAVLITRAGRGRTPAAPPGFHLAEGREAPSWRLVRFRAGASTGVGPPVAEAARLAEPAPAIRLQRPG